jgi:hypothetical protein
MTDRKPSEWLPKDRVQAALEQRPTDKVPIYQASVSSDVASKVLGREAFVGGGAQRYREAVALWNGPDAHAEFIARSHADAIAWAEALDLDYVRPEYWRMNRKPTRRLDDVTFLYGDPDGDFEVWRYDPETELYSCIDRTPRPDPTFEDLEAQVVRMEARLAEYRPTPADFPTQVYAVRAVGERRAIAAPGPYVCVDYHVPRWLEAVVLRPDLVGRYLDVQAEEGCRLAEAMAQMGLRYLMGGGDFASRHGPFYSPRAFREIMLPRLQKVSAHCAALGSYFMFASDGNLWPVADDLFGRSGVRAYYEIETLAGMDLRRLRETFPRLTLLGGVNSATLHRGTPDDVRAEVRAALDVARRCHGVIVGCSNMIVAGTPIANVEAMMQALHAERAAI